MGIAIPSPSGETASLSHAVVARFGSTMMVLQQGAAGASPETALSGAAGRQELAVAKFADLDKS